MRRTYLGNLVLRLSGLLLCACAADSVRPLDPTDLRKSESGVFGHIKVYDKGTDVTDRCRVHVGDGVTTSNLRLPEDGWIFLTSAVGRAHIQSVRCLLGTVPAYTFSVAPRIPIPVHAGALAYFGHYQ